LILGSENYGVDMELLSLSDFVVNIPMLGTNSSMNVASACSIVSYELTRQLKLKE
jgi:tRNA G18 (ribose-2'-O)-methylase SpoU